VSNQNFGKRFEHAKYQMEVTNKGWRIYPEKTQTEHPASKQKKSESGEENKGLNKTLILTTA